MDGVANNYSVKMLSLLAAGMLAGCSTAPIPLTSCADRGPITLAEYYQLADDQTLAETNALFGCTGKLRQGIVGEGAYTIEWIGGAGGDTSVMGIFVNDRLNSLGTQKYGF